MPLVPKLAAEDACGAPSKTSARQVISKSVNPDAATTAASSASSRAPAIQPVQRSMSCFASSGTGLSIVMSPICRRPVGLSTRAISPSALALSGVRLRTPFEMLNAMVEHRAPYGRPRASCGEPVVPSDGHSAGGRSKSPSASASTGRLFGVKTPIASGRRGSAKGSEGCDPT